jgi:hypothetical protein
MNLEIPQRVDCYGTTRYGELANEFRHTVKGYNFITPHLKGYFRVNSKEHGIGVGEVTTGDKFPHNQGIEMWGVTVCINSKNRNDLSKCLHSQTEVEAYIKELQNNIVS